MTIIVITKADRVAAFEKVFGMVNVSATKRVSAENLKHGETYREMRVGKTARDKARGHQPYRKNVRIWTTSGVRGKGAGSTGSWVKR